MRAVRLVLLVAAALGAVAAPARAAGLEVGMEDERLIVSDPVVAEQAAADWKAEGVDIVRIHARWGQIAPARRPHDFHPSDPADRHYQWATLDGAVSVARAAGLKVMLTVTGPGPLWTSRDPSRHNPLWEPSATAFGAFAHAVAARYRDSVDRYLIWNEPNQPGWLQPQWSCPTRRTCTPVSPHVYRQLVRAAVPAIHTADPGSEVLMGELAPIGDAPRSRSTPMAPLPFLRSMACVDAAYRPLHGGWCQRFRPATADAFGYHPHPVLRAPDERNPDTNEAQFADLGRLFAVLDRLGRSERLGRAGIPVHLTEFGYQTSPPDHAIGITLAQQTRYLQEAAFIAWRWPRVRSLSYYQWEDEPVVYRGRGTRAYSGWQSGLRFVSGKPKPVLSTFAAPFVIDRGTSGALLWGQVRPAALPRVTVLIRGRGERSFEPLITVPTAADGSWSKHIPVVLGASYRYSWTPLPTATDLDPAPRLSGIVDLGVTQHGPLRAAAAIASG